MKRLLLLALVFALTAGTGRAQSTEWGERDEVFVEQARPTRIQQATTAISRTEAIALVRERLLGGDQSVLDAYFLRGFDEGGHFALIRQDGARNVAHIDQQGAANLAVMYQTGSGNSTHLVQIGARNTFGAWLTGDDNLLNVTQNGTGNVYLFAYEGSGLTHSVVQKGIGLKTIQLGKHTRPVSVTQRGRGMQVIIRHH